MTRRRFDLTAFRWEGVEEREYKQSGGRDGVARFPLARAGAGFEVRYFEIAPGGHSSLEKHEHVTWCGAARPGPRAGRPRGGRARRR